MTFDGRASFPSAGEGGQSVGTAALTPRIGADSSWGNRSSRSRRDSGRKSIASGARQVCEALARGREREAEFGHQWLNIAIVIGN